MQRSQSLHRSAKPRGFRAPANGREPSCGMSHPFTRVDENKRLYAYEQQVKQSFDGIEAVLRKISSLQHEADFSVRAQNIAVNELGFELPEELLTDNWIKPLDMNRIYAWSVFETFCSMSDRFFDLKPLEDNEDHGFQKFLEECGFHTMDVSPCADGRLAHVIRYVLRLPYKNVRRKSYAGAMFDVDDSLQKWVETEMLRYREARPNSADTDTRYLKVAVYHHSSSQPGCEGCAAHGSDAVVAATAALERLKDFRKSIENSFCCGASIDLLLIGLDTDNDVIRLHLPNGEGEMSVDQYVDAADLYNATRSVTGVNAEAVVNRYIENKCSASGISLPMAGMQRLCVRLLCGNLSQIDYVRKYHGGCYGDIGHQERFIGMGIGFEEIQLRNLTYFAYLQTVEEGAKDVDVGVKIFTGLNANRGLPIPVVIRYDYHGYVPGAKERAVARCHQLNGALQTRFQSYVERGLLYTLMMVRDCQNDGKAEVVGSSLELSKQEAH